MRLSSHHILLVFVLTATFVTFGGEEFGLLGSRDFIQSHAVEDKIILDIEFDCVGSEPDNDLRVGAFAVVSAGAVVLSIAAGSFMRYRRGWSWSQAARVFSLITAAVVVAAYIWLLA